MDAGLEDDDPPLARVQPIAGAQSLAGGGAKYPRYSPEPEADTRKVKTVAGQSVGASPHDLRIARQIGAYSDGVKVNAGLHWGMANVWRQLSADQDARVVCA